MSDSEDLKWWKRIKLQATAITAVLALFGATAWAIQKSAVYISLPQRLDRLEVTVKSIDRKVDAILREVK